jgi:hypothetical protein
MTIICCGHSSCMLGTMVWLSPFALISAFLVVTPEGANGLKLNYGPRSPFLPERVVEIELDHSGRRVQVDDVSLTTTESCGLCRGLDGASLLEGVFPFFESDDNEALPDGASCEDLDLLSSGVNATSPDCLGLQTAFRSLCCALSNITVASYQCEQNVQAALIGPDNGYNANVPPIPQGKFTMDIGVSLEYYHITELSITDGTLELYFGINMQWVDERLRWDPAEFGG